MQIDFNTEVLPTPCYIVDERLLTRNLAILQIVRKQTGCRILLAQKAFSMFSLYPLIGQYLDGTAASGLFEAKLGHEYMKKENHIFSPAYKAGEFDEITAVCSHIVFNSFSQWEKFKTIALAADKSCGMRVNPACSTQDHAIYDPCSPFSRLGVTQQNFRPNLLEGIRGLHFHTLCEQNADALEKTLQSVEEKFGKYLYGMDWINFGGGHHITRDDYDIQLLIDCIKKTQDTYKLQVYLEPGEAVALDAGYLVSTVIDVIDNGMPIAILDASAACHMPDVLEMPYRPKIIGASNPGENSFTYRLGGPSCLAGDVIGDYSFEKPLKAGDKIVFCDMAIYSMVKNNTFNGIPLPGILRIDAQGGVHTVRTFGYKDFKNRLS